MYRPTFQCTPYVFFFFCSIVSFSLPLLRPRDSLVAMVRIVHSSRSASDVVVDGGTKAVFSRISEGVISVVHTLFKANQNGRKYPEVDKSIGRSPLGELHSTGIIRLRYPSPRPRTEP